MRPMPAPIIDSPPVLATPSDPPDAEPETLSPLPAIVVEGTSPGSVVVVAGALVVTSTVVVVPAVVEVVVSWAGAAVSWPPRSPGCAIARALPTTSSAAAAPRISFSGVFRTTHLVGELERATGIEPAPPAWKAGALAVELRPPDDGDGSRPGTRSSNTSRACRIFAAIWSGRGDLNPRPPAPKAGALPLRHSPLTAPSVGESSGCPETPCQVVSPPPIDSPLA
jgi:hypothetical protein